MDITKFTDNKSGQLAPILTPEKDFAFIPESLPPRWQFDAALWPLLGEAKWRLGRLDGLAHTLPNPQLFLKPLQRVESLTSSRLEGTYATAQELMLFELDPKEPHNAGDQSNSWLEVANYNHALAQGFAQLDVLPFCCRLIKDLHKTLLAGVRGSAKNPGEFRRHQVHIGSNRRYVPPPPEEALRAMNELEHYLNAPADDFDPLVRCFIVHYQIEAIHPFPDGNGRIGRVLLSLMIYKSCGLQMPWLYLSPYFERYKDEYIDNLFRVSAAGDWSRWLEFCLRGVIDQSQKAVQTCEALQQLKSEMHDRVRADMRPRIHGIIESLFEWPLVRTAALAKKHKVGYATAKADVEYLVQKAILKQLPDNKPRTFIAHEVFRIAYSDHEQYEPAPAG